MIAKKTDPKLWERSKEAACHIGKLCKHSARKMQWATQYYKKKGGGYVGSKTTSNRLVRWTKQKWRTADGGKSGGRKRYLPEKAWQVLSPRERRETNRAKLKGYKRGKQYVRQPSSIRDKVRRFRK